MSYSLRHAHSCHSARFSDTYHASKSGRDVCVCGRCVEGWVCGGGRNACVGIVRKRNLVSTAVLKQYAYAHTQPLTCLSLSVSSLPHIEIGAPASSFHSLSHHIAAPRGGR